MVTENKISWEAAVVRFRDDPDNSDLARACFYDDPLYEAAERYRASSEWRSLRGLLPASTGTALDIGSGRGISAYAFARDGWQVTALEPDPSMIVGAGAIRALAQTAGLEIAVAQEWGEQLPFADATFDAVHCRAVLHHARDLTALGREIARVLKPGGTFVGAREHVVNDHSDIPVFQAAHPLHHLYGGEYAYTLEEYQTALTGAGLELTQVLNSFASDVNLFPDSRAEVRRRIASKLGLPMAASLVPGWLLNMRGRRDQTPGRLYTFVARKPS